MLGLAIGKVGRLFAQPGCQGGALCVGEMQVALRLFERPGQLCDAIGLALLRHCGLPL